MLEVPYLIGIWSLVFDTPMNQILSVYIDFEGLKNIHVFQVLSEDLEDAGSYYMGFGILTFILIHSETENLDPP